MSNNKMSKQKTAALAMVGVVVAAALVAAVSFAPIAASAQERGNEDVRVHKFRTASGIGVATDIETGEDSRSAFRAIWHNDNSTGERIVHRGVIVISVDEERVSYVMLPDTWKIEGGEDGLTFEASGQVENGGRVFDVSLNGYLGGPVGFVKRVGTTWSVDGVMAGEEREYELHYVMMAPLGRLAVIGE
ncbi:MAG TPA: hypothetical protein VFS46_07870 [Nitrososphaera sp.]|nr:hypothetical protein [Nitrososphaera sp.]